MSDLAPDIDDAAEPVRREQRPEKKKGVRMKTDDQRDVKRRPANRIRSMLAGATVGLAVIIGTVAAVPAQAETSSVQLCEETLRPGSSGACVESLQTRLNELGLRNQLVVDGAFGPATRNAVEAFQGRASLDVDGVVGAATRDKLNEPGDVNLEAPSSAEVEQLIRDVFPDNVENKAIEVAKCESTLNPLAIGRNTNGSRDYGVFQFNSGGTLQEYMSGPAEALDAEANINAALELYNDRGWQPWVCA